MYIFYSSWISHELKILNGLCLSLSPLSKPHRQSGKILTYPNPNPKNSKFLKIVKKVLIVTKESISYISILFFMNFARIEIFEWVLSFLSHLSLNPTVNPEKISLTLPLTEKNSKFLKIKIKLYIDTKECLLCVFILFSMNNVCIVDFRRFLFLSLGLGASIRKTYPNPNTNPN